MVEGLNGSGKSTYIENCIQEIYTSRTSLITDWINRLRWNANGVKVNLCRDQKDMDIYCYAAYETLYNTYAKCIADDLYLDRSWISAHVYGNLSDYAFDKIAEVYLGYENKLNYTTDVVIVYIDTDIEVCKKRWADRIVEEKSYVAFFDWNDIKSKFDHDMNLLAKKGFHIETIRSM